MIEMYEKLEEMFGAVEKSDIKKLTAVLNEKQTQIMVKDIINIRGYSYQQRAFRTPLQACIYSLYNYDFKNPLKCDNYKCFIKLLEIKGINPNQRGKTANDSAPFLCLAFRKHEYFKVLVERFGINNNNNNNNYANEHGLSTTIVDKNPISTDDYDDILRWAVWNGTNCERFKMLYEMVYNNKRHDINDLFILCCMSTNGYDGKRSKTCENFKIFKYLLEKPSIDVNCKWKSGAWENKTTAIIELVNKKKYDYLEYIFDLEKNNDNINFGIDYNKQLINGTGVDLLFTAANGSDYRTLKVLLGASNHWDINKRYTRRKKTAICAVASVHTGYTESFPFVGSNFETYKVCCPSCYVIHVV